MAPPSMLTGTSDVLVRTTAVLFTVGGVAAALLAADVVLVDGPRGAPLLVLALVAALTGPALLLVGHRIRPRGIALTVLAAAAVLGVGTTLAPTLTLALASASVSTLVGIESALFLRRRDAWLVVALAGVCQVVPLLAVHDVPPLVCAAYAVLWGGVAGVVGVLARHAATSGVDALTGLTDRRGWDAALGHAIDRRERRGQPLSLALIDIDHFKRINDAQGHAAGDELLRATAAAWCGIDVPGMVLGRRGGDEFAVLLPGSTGPEALAIAERLCASAPTPASCGVAEHVEGETGAEVLRRTDTALYAAKAAGRGRTVLSERRRLSLADDLARSLAAGDLRVALQPIVELSSRRVVGVEALARWDHPRRGPVPPTEFVTAAEDGGLIDELGAQVLALACADAHTLQTAWARPVQMGINVSGRELVGQGYAARVLGALESARWPATQFVLEVTESVVEASGPAALRALRALRDGGVRIAIDDFGTGFSSLSRLDELPADFLKLDRQFVSSLTTSARRSVMVRALLGMCVELDMLVIAEGVETPEQARLLEELGCPAAQGYWFARPQPVAELAALPWCVVGGAAGGVGRVTPGG
ncbi:putative bifunctional diguanylate cyclase/phosphodiesterase [Cellulomonas sp. S1-8]|uniref:putative bifunctional diguanylate cyclase/phosphodiesterase n=1 Tax=Cellulomonas sp. S1-8 TaxID=2904790 RepID=UPI002244B5EE|nr:bifunctional diguanylate cyclase/phosphodiesterase [Cellulomonas sp. S1-8]UZN03627.1 bifunctional diguanylate cyclase/phosphodiesterase [Cellulomonas sp. S1-8]